MCPGSSDPFYLVSYYIKGSLLAGHTVQDLYKILWSWGRDGRFGGKE